MDVQCSKYQCAFSCWVFFYKMYFFQILSRIPLESQTVRSRSGPTFCWFLSGSKLFALGYQQIIMDEKSCHQQVKSNYKQSNNGTGQTAQMCRLACTYVVHINIKFFLGTCL